MSNDRPACVLELKKVPTDAVALKALDDLMDHVRHVNERARDRLARHGHSVAKRYVEGTGGLLLKFDLVRFNIGQKYVAIFHELGLRVARDLAAELLARYAGVAGGRNDQLVFIDNIQIVERSEKIIPSGIWLERVDNLPASGVKGGTELIHSLFLAGSILPKRETGSARNVPGQGREVANKNVERTTEVVNDIADDRSDLLRDCLLDADAHAALSDMRIELADQSIRASPGVGGKHVVKLVEVAFCPFQF